MANLILYKLKIFMKFKIIFRTYSDPDFSVLDLNVVKILNLILKKKTRRIKAIH